MDNIKEKLIQLLTKIFQFENEDLDFGIYKILNYKKDEISKFIEKDLIEEISKELDLLSSEEKKALNQDLDRMKKELQEYGFPDYESSPKYIAKKKELEKLNVSEELENHIYNHIYAFFSRYYDKGDFISKRRYGRNNKYMIPYNGEETLLYWANKDQYYIKTREFLLNYSFKVPDLKVNFRVVEAEEDKGNVKSDEKFFIVFNDQICIFEDKELNIYFEYRGLTKKEKTDFSRPNQDKINNYNLKILIDTLAKEPKFEKLLKTDDDKTIIEKHLNRYTARNTYDYFIHKNLKGFLDLELDFYIKNEILDLSNITQLDKDYFQSYLLEIKVIKNICSKIIDFLSQIENFQKKLWEKKKFVLTTDYIISLNKIPVEFHEEILNNYNQINEWKDLFSFEVKSKSDLQNESLDGVNYKKLPVDTKFFSSDVKNRLIEKISENRNLEEDMDGILIKSDNYHGITTLLEKYKGKIKCIYIDPPYNTGGDAFVYKDNYKHSSWLTMVENRLKLSKNLLRDDGSIFISIDDNELSKIIELLNQIYGEENFVSQIIVQSNKGGRDYLQIAKTHEYLVCYSKSSDTKLNELPKDTSSFKYSDKLGKYEIRELRNRNPKFNRSNRPNLYYPFYINPKSKNENGFCSVSLKKEGNYSVSTVPKNKEGKDSCWRWGKDLVLKNIVHDNLEESQVIAKQKNNGGWNIYEKHRKSTKKAKSIWDEKEVRTENGTIRLRNLFGESLFNHPKPVELVEKVLRIGSVNNDMILDFLAGSGTTADAVLSLNQKEGYNLKFILIEIADYFEDLILPRIKKVCFTSNWENLTPLDQEGKGGFFKYIYLEQYEDSLENIEFSQKALDDFNDYFISYMLDFETRDSKTFLNIDKMENPFDYKIKVLDDYQSKTVPVDLPETYNYLIGLEVSKIMSYENEDDNNRRYLVYKGKSGNGNILVIWRDIINFDPQKDRKFLNENIITQGFDEIHLNGDSLIPDAVLIQENFKRLMNGS